MNYKIKYDESFVNPYNFVGLPKGKVNRAEISSMPGLTGKLHCKITTKTPLAILDTDYREDNKHKIYAFNTIDGKKVISGSSIRGCIRSVYETLTDSCFVTMNDKAYISNRADPHKAYKPGLLVKKGEKWNLYSAQRWYVRIAETPIKEAKLYSEAVKVNDEGISERYIEDNGVEYCFGDFVTVSTIRKDEYSKGSKISRYFITQMQKSNKETDYCLYIGEPMECHKYYQSVFKRDCALKIDDEKMSSAVNLLDFVVSMYRDKAINRNLSNGKHSGYGGYERAKRSGTIPVWYSWDEVNHNLSLSLAAIGRKVYQKKVNDLSNRRDPCQKGMEACPACALFGMSKREEIKEKESKVSEGEGTKEINGIGSKVRFSDAFITKEGSSSYVTLKELGAPRTGYSSFYSANGEEFDNPGAEISGRKFYWHIPEASVNEDIYKESGKDSKTERNATVEVLKDSEFEFDVYYDNVSEKQLSELKYALTFGDKKDGSLCHKLGHGKPIGLGSVKITIESETIRKFDEAGYFLETMTDVDTSCDSDRFSEHAKKELLRMSDINAVKGEKVCYPYVLGKSTNANDTASHQWFTKNKNERNVQRLSVPTDNSQVLHPYEFVKDNPNKSTSEYQIGKEYAGVVTSWNKTWAQISLTDGGKASIRDSEPHKYSVNQKLVVIYRGKQKDGIHDRWDEKKS